MNLVRYISPYFLTILKKLRQKSAICPTVADADCKKYHTLAEELQFACRKNCNR